MISDAAITIESRWGLMVGIALVFISIGAIWIRGVGLGRITLVPAAMGGILLAIGAGLPAWNRPSEKWVEVMVDLSASTRTAAYRDRGALERRVAALLRNVPHRISYFADGRIEAPQGGGDALADGASERTVMPTPDGAAAVLLLSDCRFELPAQIAPTYVVIDPKLEEVGDAAVSSLKIRGDRAEVTVANKGKARGITVRGVKGGGHESAPAGSVVLSRQVAAGAAVVGAELTVGDAWPENDALFAEVPAKEKMERWWVGKGAAPEGWRAVAPGDLPNDAGAYLSAAVVVLDDVSAGELSEAQQQRLAQYVRDAGGGLVILGGERAFGAGGYSGTPIDRVSPLASLPPEPMTHWIVLVDASGSMGGAVQGGGTRWDYAMRAAKAVVAAIPPEDLVSMGGFAEGVNWWAEGKRAKDMGRTPLPPGEVYPHGPTNLEQAMDTVLRAGSGIPVQVLVISDFDAKVGDGAAMAEGLKARKIRVHLLAIGEGSALKAMLGVSSETGGFSMTQLDPTRWATAARELLRATVPTLVRKDAIHVGFEKELSAEAGQEASVWNRTWVKEGATKLAEGLAGAESVPMAARWNVGEGQVVAAGFEPGAAQVEAMAGWVARKPRDPKYRVSWEAEAKVHVMVDAIEEETFINGLHVTVEMLDQSVAGAARVMPLVQTGPGRYEMSVDAPRAWRLVTVRVEGRAIERFAVAGRYAPEFEAVGNDHAAMEELARKSGGRVVVPTEKGPIDESWPVEKVSLTSQTATLGAALLLLALWSWRRS